MGVDTLVRSRLLRFSNNRGTSRLSPSLSRLLRFSNNRGTSRLSPSLSSVPEFVVPEFVPEFPEGDAMFGLVVVSACLARSSCADVE